MIYFFVYLIISFVFFSSFNQGKLHNRNLYQLAILLFILSLIVGMGDMLGGYDRYGYGQLFDYTADDVMEEVNPMVSNSAIMGYSSEMSYVIMNVLIAHITANRYIFILMLTLLIYLMLFLSLKDYLENYPLGLLMFTALFFFFTFTYLRQVCATCFAWFAFRYVMKRKMIPFLICWFVAYKFHNSAIIFFPMYFLPIKKYPKKTIILVMILLFIIGSTGVSARLYTMYGDTTGADLRSAQYEMTGHSFRIDYMIEVIVFLYFIFKRYDKIPNDVKHIVFLNASMVFCAILLFFITNSSAGRQSWYYMIGIIFTLSNLATQQKKLDFYLVSLYSIMTVLFLRFDILWGPMINPYKTFLTNGHRSDDAIFYEFEYDMNYDKDKLYRPVFYLK